MKLSHLTNTRPGFSDLVLYESMVANGVFCLRDGSLMAAWKFRGPDMASRTHSEMAGLSSQINRILMLGSGWMVQCDAIRSSAEGYPAAIPCPDPVTQLIDEERRAEFMAEGQHFESDYYFCVTYQPPAAAEEKAKGWLFKNDAAGNIGVAERALRYFIGKVCGIEDGLRSAFDVVERLGYDADTGFDGLMAYVHRCITGIHQPITLPEFPFGLQDVVACVDFVGGTTPIIDGKHLRIVAIDGFPRTSTPGILHALDTLAIEYRWSTRALLLDAEEAKARIAQAGKDWFFKINPKVQAKITDGKDHVQDLDAAQMHADAMGNSVTGEVGAYGEASSGEVQFAYYTSKIVLMDSDLERLRESIALTQKVIRKHGFGARLETVNSVEAYLGSLPGDGYRDLRRSMVHTLNLADMLPLTSVWTGSAVCPSPLMPPDSPALLYATTTGAAPFFFNLHVGDVGHTLIVGPTGSGKSTSLALIAAQFMARYPGAQVFVFDKDYSMRALTAACGGEFYDPAKLAASGYALQPLGHLETPSDIAWACGYVETLCALQGLTLGPRERGLLADGVELLRSSDRRGITELLTNVQEAKVQEALRPYTEKYELGSLIDGHRERIQDGRFVTFELSGLMGLGERTVSAVLPYLFRRISRQLEHGKGEPTLIILDEGWAWLKNERFADQMSEWLRVMRKQNCAVILATPSLADIFDSAIGPVILQACKTKLLLADAEATNPETQKLYQQLGLRDRECQLIAEGKPKGDCYVLSHDGRRMINIRVGPVGLAFCGCNSKEQRAAIDNLIARYGSRWPAEHLRMRGLSEWAEKLKEEMPCGLSMAGD